MSDLYGSADIERCRERGHKFQLAWSDKTPLKMSMMCRTCTESSGKPTYVAYGIEHGSFGAWPSRRRQKESDERQDETL